MRYCTTILHTQSMQLQTWMDYGKECWYLNRGSHNRVYQLRHWNVANCEILYDSSCPDQLRSSSTLSTLEIT
jgi:hypothetical protein